MESSQGYRESECISVSRNAAKVEIKVIELINKYGFDKDAVMWEMQGTGHEKEAEFCFNWMKFTAEMRQNKKKSI